MTGTVASDRNAALVKNAYDAFSRADVKGALAAFADDIRWHVPGRGPLSRDYRGHAEVLGFFEHFRRRSDGTFQLRVLTSAERVVVQCTTTAQRRERDQQTEDEFWSLP